MEALVAMCFSSLTTLSPTWRCKELILTLLMAPTGEVPDADSSISDLHSGDGMTGRRGEDIYVKVPCGTIVSERLSQSQLLGSLEETDLFGNEPDAHDIDPPSVDLDEHGKCILVARGGKPGLGNKALSGGKGKLFRSAVIPLPCSCSSPSLPDQQQI
jgi:hypothetical protein